MKRFFGPQAKDTPASTPSHSNIATPASTPSHSNIATPIPSPAGSIINVDMHRPHDKYHNDPMRTGKKPDTIGNFLDPMGGHGSYSVSRDVTNTGA